VRLEWSVWAQANRDAIFDYIEADSPRAAVAVDKRISDESRRCGGSPETAAPVALKVRAS
jgi:toxin ParE1/3/4